MPRKPTPKPDDPSQSQRFLDAAKKVGADQDEEALERAFKKVALQPRQRERQKQSE